MAQLILRPNGTGDLGAESWYKVDEEVLDINDFVMVRMGQDRSYLYTLPDRDPLKEAGTINSVTVYVVAANAHLALVSEDLYILLKSGGIVYSSPIIATERIPTLESHAFSLAWTWDKIDAMQIGARLVVDKDESASFYQVYVVIDYDSVPLVDTSVVSAIEETTATGNGNITDVGAANATKRGFCYNTTGDPTVADSTAEDTGTYTAGTFSKGLTGLSPGTKYYLRAYAYNSEGYGYGDVVEFITKPNPPTGLACTVIDDSQINLAWTKGTGAEKTKIIRKVGSYPTSITDGDEVYFGTAEAYQDTGLSRVTHYYYRAWSYKTDAPNSGYSDSYSSDDDSTLAEYPTITINDATDILATSFTANATISDDGGVLIDERGFQYGLTKVAKWNNTESLGSYEEGDFDLAIESLSSNTYYWIRAFATNTRGTTYTDWIAVETAASGSTPRNTLITLTGDVSGYVSQLHGDEDNDLDYPYDAYFVIATDLSESNSLVFKKRLLDLFNYFRTEDAGDMTVSIKCDHETSWREIGTLSLTGDDDVVLPHLAPDELGRHFLIKFSGNNVFRYLGTIFKFIVQGER